MRGAVSSYKWSSAIGGERSHSQLVAGVDPHQLHAITAASRRTQTNRKTHQRSQFKIKAWRLVVYKSHVERAYWSYFDRIRGIFILKQVKDIKSAFLVRLDMGRLVLLGEKQLYFGGIERGSCVRGFAANLTLAAIVIICTHGGDRSSWIGRDGYPTAIPRQCEGKTLTESRKISPKSPPGDSDGLIWLFFLR